MAWTAERTAEQAAAIAAQFFAEQGNYSMARKSAMPTLQPAQQYNKNNTDTPAFYVFNRTDQDGFVVVSADDRTESVLAYSDEGGFDNTDINPSLRWWLQRYQRQLSAWTDSTARTATNRDGVALNVTTAVAPLMTAKWDQEAPYYNNCPKDLFSSELCPTGCVATAAAQIMYKWKYPAKGAGSHNYEWCDYGTFYWELECETLRIKFDTVVFDWTNMKDIYKKYTPQQARAVASLMYACGVACDMSYSSDGSGAWTDDMGYGLITYFDYTYSKFVTTYTRSQYSYYKDGDVRLDKAEYGCSLDSIQSYINDDLEAGRPVLMGGWDEDYGGHEFVCDGRDTQGRFHINWGWGGAGNGYFSISNLGPTDDYGQSYNFSEDLDAMIGLEPAHLPSALPTVSDDSQPQKILRQGHLLIRHDSRWYNTLGNKIR
ncbi:MAG: C10 family peptidase [Paludibacteraceae bacterium]|nr:C10 family peptidase [Paludibacteraceae bacterium]